MTTTRKPTRPTPEQVKAILENREAEEKVEVYKPEFAIYDNKAEKSYLRVHSRVLVLGRSPDRVDSFVVYNENMGVKTLPAENLEFVVEV